MTANTFLRSDGTFAALAAGDAIGQVKVGVFTRDTSLATGTQAVTGVGFKPRAVIFLAGDVGASSDGGIGIDDGTSSGALVNFNAIAAGNFQAVSGGSIKFVQSASNVYAGSIQSLDSDGFTISWVKTASPTGTKTISYLAIG